MRSAACSGRAPVSLGRGCISKPCFIILLPWVWSGLRFAPIIKLFFLLLSRYSQKMPSFSGFASQPPSLESQIRGDLDRLLKLCTNFHPTSCRIGMDNQLIPASADGNVEIGGVCLPKARVSAKTLGLQLELELCI